MFFIRNGILEFLCEEKTNEMNNMTLALQILNGSGKWQIFRFLKNEISQYNAKTSGITLLDLAVENNNLPIIAFLINNKAFMQYYDTLPNKREIFFARLKKITNPYITSIRDLIPIKISIDPIKEDLASSLKSLVFLIETKENGFEGFSKQIALLLGYFAQDLDEKTKAFNEYLSHSGKKALKKVDIEVPLFIDFNVYSHTFPDNNNFLLKALPFLDMETVF